MSELPKIYWNNLALLERDWLTGKTDWWPDSISLSDADPSSGVGMPRLGVQRINDLSAQGRQVCDTMAVGVHCWRIGFAGDFLLPNAKDQPRR